MSGVREQRGQELTRTCADEVLELQPKEFLRLQTRFERVPRNPDWLATLAWAVLDRDRFLHPKLLRYADELLAAAALDLSGRSRNLVQRGMLLTLEENWTLVSFA